MRSIILLLLLALANFTNAHAIAVIEPLYHFDLRSTNAGGPFSGLTLGNDGFFYGTTPPFLGRSTNVPATVFRLSSSGEHSIIFAAQDFSPSGPLIQDQAGNFFGVTDFDADGNGSVYELTSAGQFKRLVLFEGALNGNKPYGRLLLGSDGKLYGTTQSGGLNNTGSVFALDQNGVLTTLHFFDQTEQQALGGLLEPKPGVLYGATTLGSPQHIFTVTTRGQFQDLIPLDGTNGFGFVYMLLARDGNIYGTTKQGGQNGIGFNQGGVFFRMRLDGSYTNLASFSSAIGTFPNALVQAPDGTFYGTAEHGGQFGFGTVFKATPTGEITLLASFDGQNGREPHGELVYGRDGQLYGITRLGGKNNAGTFFRLTNRPLVAIDHNGAFLALSWDSTPGQVYKLETTGDLNSNTWLVLRDGINSTGSKTSISLPQPTAQTFFRIAADATE